MSSSAATALTGHAEEAAVRVPLEHYMQGHARDDASPTELTR